jgi:hypothetical protein
MYITYCTEDTKALGVVWRGVMYITYCTEDTKALGDLRRGVNDSRPWDPDGMGMVFSIMSWDSGVLENMKKILEGVQIEQQRLSMVITGIAHQAARRT